MVGWAVLGGCGQWRDCGRWVWSDGGTVLGGSGQMDRLW